MCGEPDQPMPLDWTQGVEAGYRAGLAASPSEELVALADQVVEALTSRGGVPLDHPVIDAANTYLAARAALGTPQRTRG